MRLRKVQVRQPPIIAGLLAHNVNKKDPKLKAIMKNQDFLYRVHTFAPLGWGKAHLHAINLCLEEHNAYDKIIQKIDHSMLNMYKLFGFLYKRTLSLYRKSYFLNTRGSI